MNNTDGIILYGTSWCADCMRSRRVLEGLGIDYRDIDIENNPEAAEFVESINNGNQTVPTILFPDGSLLVEPTSANLISRLESLNLIKSR